MNTGRDDNVTDEAELAYITALIREQAIRQDEITNVPPADVFDAVEDIGEVKEEEAD
ncbi:hypothetical protein [Paenibacillus spongiae]|uniref:Uncharacterized protein n=1 Tax=Paenibacillus spongiae TaxID=2909671 RepID=A0ABY5SEN7_9BACL|nr:hypothetical protein [Paenibacillus spongiae]UVI30733.1 hypothetical protein L1F29_02300 [Paenibacillus spongiae]